MPLSVLLVTVIVLLQSVCVSAANGGAGAASGTGAGAAVRDDSVALAADEVAPSVTIGLLTRALMLLGAAIAAIGVIKMAKESRQATNTLRGSDVDSRIDFSTSDI